MTTYNTGNPVPSADARDRYDNSQTLDEVVNGDSESCATRTGKQVISLGGMNSRFNNAQDERESEYSSDKIARDTEFEADQVSRSEDFEESQDHREVTFAQFLDGSGWSSLGVYAAGISITSHTQTVDYLGQPYQLKPSIPASLDAPYVTTGVWATEGVNFKLVGDNSLRQDLAEPQGCEKLGVPLEIGEPSYSKVGTSANKFAVAPISLWDFVGFLSAGDRSGAPDEWDWSAAITALNDAVKARIRKFAPLLGDRFNYIESLVRVDLTGVFGYSNTLILWPGVRYDLDVASRLYARAAGQCMVRTPTVAELAASPAGATYGSKNSGLTGGGYVDGANLASVGALLDTVAAGCRYDVTIVRCTNSRFTTTGTGSAGSSDLTVASAANIQKYDVVYIAADMLTSPARKGNQYYIVKSITGNVVTFTMPLSSALSGATVVHRAVGAIGAMAQQSKIELNTTWNDIGQVWCQNSDGFRCTDISISGMSHENMVGTVIAGFEGMLVKPTIQHNYGSELVIVETIGMSLYTPFIESLSDASANTNSTPTGGAPIGASALRGFPMIDIRDNARNVRFIDISWPPNSGSVQFRRLLSNQGLHTLVDGARGQLATLNENPDAPGEVAPFLAYSIGSMRVINFRGPTATDLAQKLVVSETGGTPVSYSASWEVFSSSVNSGRTSKTVNYSISSAEIVASYRLIGEAFDRCGVSASGINLGGGSVAPDTLLRRTSSGVAGADGLKCVQSAWNTKHFAIGNFEWWMTAGSRPRFAAGPPTSDASGVAVSCTVPVPGSATAPGQPGDEAASATFIYKYIGDGTTHSWVRSAATSW